jgi:hypothetical protein
MMIRGRRASVRARRMDVGDAVGGFERGHDAFAAAEPVKKASTASWSPTWVYSTRPWSLQHAVLGTDGGVVETAG